MNMNATLGIAALKRIETPDQARAFSRDVLLLPPGVEAEITSRDMVRTRGLPGGLDRKEKDLLRVVRIEEPTELRYEKTNILVPRTYAESLPDIPCHISVQGILLTVASPELLAWLRDYAASSPYGKTPYDAFWLPFGPALEDVPAGRTLFLMNRRVGGWDGSPDRPVIELLGAGGHLPSVWNEASGRFEELSFCENFQKELREELGLTISPDSVRVLGGFHNEKSHELVVLCAIYVASGDVRSLQLYAKGNLAENVDGLYVGDFHQTMAAYRRHPEYFAGGAAAFPYNFPSREELMRRITAIL